MIYPDVDIDEWRRRHNLPNEAKPCMKCGVIYNLCVPVMLQGMVGVASLEHACGPGYVAITMTPYSKESKKFWADFTEWMEMGPDDENSFDH